MDDPHTIVSQGKTGRSGDPGGSDVSVAPASVFDGVDLTKEFDGGKVLALRGINFRITEGEFVAILGASGSGKSTLLQLLGALDHPTTGKLHYRGESLAEMRTPAGYRARQIGFIFQAFHLLPTFTALENVQIPMFEGGLPPKARRERAHSLLTAVGLGHRLHHLPSALSGGERQRVAIARSLANEPSVLLADEPTGNLDSENAALILDLLLEVHRERRMTVILVTHDLAVAHRARRRLHMKDGRIVSDDSTNVDVAP